MNRVNVGRADVAWALSAPGTDRFSHEAEDEGQQQLGDQARRRTQAHVQPGEATQLGRA